ncbi:ankyrin repeat protein, partial [Ostertagia ostertagi]
MAGADVNCVDPSTSMSAMQVAVAAGNAHLVNLFINHGGLVHQTEGDSALTIAAKHGHMDLLPLLLPLDGMKTAAPALVEGARNGHVKVRQKSVKYWWTSFECNDFAKAMCAACEHGQAETVQFFLSRGASLSTMQWPAERPALICAVESGSWDLVVAVFALPNCDIECKDAFGRTPIIAAARCAHVGLIDMLLNKGADINQRDDYGWTALVHAVHKNHLPSVQLLLDRSADITGKDKN